MENFDNTQHSQETSIYVPGGIPTQISASERPQLQALDRAVTGIGSNLYYTGTKWEYCIILLILYDLILRFYTSEHVP